MIHNYKWLKKQVLKSFNKSKNEQISHNNSATVEEKTRLPYIVNN